MTVWTKLAQEHGKSPVIHAGISDEEYDAITARQVAHWLPLLAAHLNGSEKVALDFGCGAGRFSRSLAHALGHDARVIAYDPTPEMLEHAPCDMRVQYVSQLPESLKVDALFIWCVFGGIADDWALWALVAKLSTAIKPGGLLFFADHTAEEDPGRWWKFRRPDFYARLWKFCGIPVAQIGECMQYRDAVTIFAGRKA